MATSPHSPERPRAVFDCNVLLQAVVRDTGPSFACLEMAEAGIVTLCVSQDTLAEVRAVLTRPVLRQKFSALTPLRIAAFLKHLRTISLLIDPVPSRITYDRDPKDVPYLDLALVSRAQYLVSRDQDFLALMDSGNSVGQQFLALADGLTILDPATFLQTMRARPSGQRSGRSNHLVP